MKKLWMGILMAMMILSALPVAADSVAETVTVIPSAQTVTPHGRTYYKEDKLWFNWTNSGFSFSFTGTQAQATLITDSNLNAFVNVYVDGSDVAEKTIQLRSMEKEFVLASGLPEGEHTITLRRRIENRDNITAALVSITVTGQMLPPPEKAGHTVEVIGDSISCGFGNLRDGNRYSGNQPVAQDGTRTFATLATGRFDTETTVIAHSGIGFAYNHGGNTTNTMKDVYGYTDFYQLGTDALWDFANNPSELVIIALGTNDTSAPSQEAYAKGAKEFLALVREKNPDAIIIWAYEILTASFNQHIRQAVADANAAGDDKVYYHALGMMDRERDGVGLDGHPSLTTHIKDAEGLADLIAQVTGWERKPESRALQVKFKEESGLTRGVGNKVIVAPPEYLKKTGADLKAVLEEQELLTLSVEDDQPLYTGVTITRTENPFVTDTRGFAIQGDVDGSGGIDAADALAILRHVVGNSELYGMSLEAAKVGREEITAGNALQVLKYAVGKITEF